MTNGGVRTQDRALIKLIIMVEKNKRSPGKTVLFLQQPI